MALKVKTYNNVQANVTFSKASSRVEINPTAGEAATENIALTLGKISKWYEALVPTGGSSGKFLGWNSSGTAKWVDAPTSEDKNMSQTLKTDNVNRPLLMSIESTSNTTATVTTTGARNNSMYGNVSTGLIFCRGREISNVTVKTGSTAQSHITLNTLMTWLITSKQYIPSGIYCHVVLTTAWDYASSDILQASINGTNYEIQLAGVIIEFMGSATSYNAGTFRLLIHSSPTTSFTATTGYTKFPTATIAEYTCNGSSYSPVWKMMLNAHPTITLSTDTTSATPLSHGGTFTAITSVTRDSNGHTTKVNTATYTLPSDNNTTYTFATGDAVGQFKVKASTASSYTNYNVNGISAGTDSGTANLLAYYSTATKISSTPKIAYHEVNSTASTPVQRNILHLFGEGVGNDAPKLISGTVGIIGYGDGGPQINFNTASSDTVTGGQNGAIIFTDHDSAAAGVSWHFVSDQTDWNVISKRFHAKTSISIGTDRPPSTAYTFYVTGSSYYTGDIVIGTSGSSSNDTGDITWKYGNGNEKARIWFDDTYTAKQGPRFRLYKSDGTSLYSGYLPLADGTSASGTWGISITGTAASANKLNTNAGDTNRPVYFSGGIPVKCDTPVSGKWWNGVPYVGNNGVLEIGKYIDFHGSNTSTNDYDYRITAETQTIYFAPKSSGDATYNLIRMQSPDYNQIQFQTTKTDKAYTSTGIVVYPLTTSGQTMLIQSDGNTVIGGGESPRTLYSNSYDSMDTVENETLYLASDSNEIHLITNAQAYSGIKVLKVRDGQLVKSGGQWISARDTAPVYANKPNTQDGGYYPAWFAKSKSGGWSMGVLSTQDNLYITYTTDADYSASPQQNQNTYQIQFQNKSGTVALTSDIPTIPTVNNASLTLKGAGTTVTTFTANASTNQSLDIVAGTNVTITPDATNHKITIASSYTNTDTKVTQTAVGSTYTNYRPLVISASNADSAPPTATTVTDGTFITSSIYCQPSSGSVYATKFIGPLNVSRVTKDSKAFPGANKAIIEEYVGGSTYNLPSSQYYHIISIQGPDTKYGTQLALGMTTTGAYYRNYNNQTWSDWKSIINSNTTYGISGAYGANNNTWVTTITAGGSGTTSTVPTSSTSAYGITKLYNGVDSTNTGLAATANAVKTAYDKGNHSHPYLPDTTKYAGSSSAGGAATSANKLNTDAGGTYLPVYFSSGVPVAVTVRNNTSVGAIGYSSGAAANAALVTTNSIAYWNGAYNSTSSNLRYCRYGEIAPWLGNLTTIGSGSPASADSSGGIGAKAFWESANCPTGAMVSLAYNNSGDEYSFIFSKSGDGNPNSYGSVLRWGYPDLYIRILRHWRAEWKANDWEKISAGYADSAGLASSITTSAASDNVSRVVFFAYNGDTSKLVYDNNFKYNPSTGMLNAGRLTLTSSTWGGLIINRTAANSHAGIVFQQNGTDLGSISMGEVDSPLIRWKGNTGYKVYDEGNVQPMLWRYTPEADPSTATNAGLYPAYTMAYMQNSSDFGGTDNRRGYSGTAYWAHYLTFTHTTNFRYLLRLPFWGVPQYQHTTNGANQRWYSFVTEEEFSAYKALQERCYSVSSAGWYRLLTFACEGGGATANLIRDVTITVRRQYNNAAPEAFAVRIIFNYQNETIQLLYAKQDVKCFTKIRTSRSSDKTKVYVELYYDFSAKNDFSVRYDNIKCWNMSDPLYMPQDSMPANGTLTAISDSPTEKTVLNIPTNVLQSNLKLIGSYWGMSGPDGNDTAYIRTSSNGLLPYEAGDITNPHSYIGTSSYYFSAGYIKYISAGEVDIYKDDLTRQIRYGYDSIDFKYNSNGGWATGVRWIANNAVLTSIGGYGNGTALNYMWIGGSSYESPALKIHSNLNIEVTANHNILLRTHANGTYKAGIAYDTQGNECVAFWAKNAVTRFRFHSGVDMETFTTGSMMGINPDFEIYHTAVTSTVPLVLWNPTGGNTPELIFRRKGNGDDYVDWRIVNSGATLWFDYQYNSSSWTSKMWLGYNGSLTLATSLSFKVGSYETELKGHPSMSANRTIQLPDKSGGLPVSNILYENSTGTQALVVAEAKGYKYFIVTVYHGTLGEQTAMITPNQTRTDHCYFSWTHIDDSQAASLRVAGAHIKVEPASSTNSITFTVYISDRHILAPGNSSTISSAATSGTPVIRKIIGFM